MTGNARCFLLRALLCFSCVAGIVLTGCSAGGDPVAALDSSSPTPRNHFKSTWRIPPLGLDIQLPLREGYDYDFTVSWGDGRSSEVKAHDDPAASHTYDEAGDYTITIVGTLEAWYFNNDHGDDDDDKDKIIAVENFGRMGWKNLEKAFAGCENLTTFQGGDVSQVTNMSGMFFGARSLEQLNTSNWDFGSVTTMENIFEGASELTTESYSDMLMRIVDTSNKNFITLGGGPAKYNDCGAKARAILTTATRSWNITDGGAEDGGGADAAKCTKWSPSPPSPTPPGKFISTWRIPPLDLDIQLPLRSGYNYDFTVSWGDGSSSEVKAHDDPAARHTYNAAGDYTITIVGTLEAWYFNSGGDKDKIIAVENFGRMGWKNLNYAFAGCSNLTTFKGGDVSQVTDMSFMFFDALSLAQLNTSDWNVSSVTDMSYMFIGALNLKSFDLNNWDVSSVEDMKYMFVNVNIIDLDIANWDFDSVANMDMMFDGIHQLSTKNYSKMLTQIVDTSSSEKAVILGGGRAKYNDCGAKARAELVRRGWTITDAGPEAGADEAKCSPSPP